jgi:hypothetical protein
MPRDRADAVGLRRATHFLLLIDQSAATTLGSTGTKGWFGRIILLQIGEKWKAAGANVVGGLGENRPKVYSVILRERSETKDLSVRHDLHPSFLRRQNDSV